MMRREIFAALPVSSDAAGGKISAWMIPEECRCTIGFEFPETDMIEANFRVNEIFARADLIGIPWRDMLAHSEKKPDGSYCYTSLGPKASVMIRNLDSRMDEIDKIACAIRNIENNPEIK